MEMSWHFRAVALALVPILAAVQSLQAQPADELDARTVNLSIDRAVNFLLATRDKEKYSWPDHPGYPGGLTALCALAILNSGVPASDERIRPTLDHLCAIGKPSMVYSSSLIVMALSAAYPTAKAEKRAIYAARIKEHALWLQAVQISDGEKKGGWRYSKGSGGGDNSNSQFALLALHEAERTLPDLKIEDQTWRRALAYWVDQQQADGSWGYMKGVQPGEFGAPSGSMTCAGLSSVLIASSRISENDVELTEGRVQCCGDRKENDAVERGLAWLGAKFSVEQNPGSPEWQLYYLYGVERVGRLSGRRFFYSRKGAPRDWYREGAAHLIKSRFDPVTGRFAGVSGDEEHSPELATSLSLLFLAKGRRPVVIAKLRHGEPASRDWDNHRSGVPHLTTHIEKLWKKDLSWQTVDLPNARLPDLMESPVLFISGTQGLAWSAEQKRTLKEYVQQGGFLFVEACNGNGCHGEEFDQSFRKLMEEMFPDSKLRLLPPDHPAWFADEKVNPKYMKPLYGLDTCCRTSVVYCPENLSCFWELKRPAHGKILPAEVQEEVDACAAMGANVVAYATNRELKEKLDRPNLAYGPKTEVKLERGALLIPKLTHGGGSDDAPNAVRNLERYLEKQLEIRIDPKPLLISLDNEKLFDYPLVFAHGRRAFRFTAAERKSLREYLDRGGFLFADAICAQAEFAESFRKEVKEIYPEGKWQRIPTDHALFTSEFRGFELKSVLLRDPQARGADDKLTAKSVKIEPLLEGLEIDGRYVVILSPYDLSCALENGQSLECKGYVRDDAARLGANIVLYALGE